MTGYTKTDTTHRGRSSLRFGKPLGLLLLVSALAGCASSGVDYAPADDLDDVGYTEQQITDNRYRVAFTGDNLTPLETVQDYALLRAAELSVQKNYDWFTVDERLSVPLENEEPVNTSLGITAHAPTETRCGLLGCTVTRYPPAYAGTEVEFADRGPSYKTVMEVIMGRGDDRPDSAYDAREVIESVRARM